MRVSGPPKYESFSVTIVKMTKKAVLFEMNDDKSQHWAPLSCIHEDDMLEMDDGVCMELNIAQWFCEKEGLV